MAFRIPFTPAALLAASLVLHAPARANPHQTQQGSSLLRRDWFWSSMPLDPSGQPRTPVLSDHLQVHWFNRQGVLERDLDPSLTAEEGGGRQHTVLELTIGDSTTTFTPTVWTGLTRARSRLGEDLWRTQAVEVWVNDKTPNHALTRARLHVDFGRVSENAFWERNNIPNGWLDTEDRSGGVADTKLDAGEDTGLDDLMDRDEPGYDPNTNPDPNGDDYHYDQSHPADFSRINGTEGSSTGIANARPDTEDLDLNGRLDESNDYFEATIDLSDTAYVAIDVPRDYAGDPDVKPDNGWRLFRIPVSVFVTYGSPSWSSIQHERIWVDGMSVPTNIQIGGIQLVPTPASELPVRVQLSPSHPNPFKASTVVEYDLAAEGPVRLAVYDLRGRLVRELVNGIQPAGSHRATWLLFAADKERTPTGIYFFRLEAGGRTLTRKIILLR
jgi:hypothetical protein